MDRRYASWFLETLKIWSQYLAIVMAAIPAGILAAFLIARGVSEQTAMIVCVPAALSMAFAGWQVVALLLGRQSQLVAASSANTTHLRISYQLSWGQLIVPSTSFIERLTPALPLPKFTHEPGSYDESVHISLQSDHSDYKVMFMRPRGRQQQPRFVVQVKGFSAQQGIGNEPSVRADQLTRAAALSTSFDEATALIG